MGDMYRIDLSNLPAGEREKTKSMLEYADEVFLVANQPYVFDVLWTLFQSIYLKTVLFRAIKSKIIRDFTVPGTVFL